MILRNSSIKEFAEKNKGRKIVCFGAYVMPVGMCNENKELHIEEDVIYMADNDRNKHGKMFDLCGKQKEIISADMLAEKADSDTVILITSSYYASIIEQLDRYDSLINTECYVYPIMKAMFTDYEKIDPKNSDKQLIPKKIHYFWFGGNEKSELIKMCIESWKKYCPDYEIIEWNESNYDVSKNRFMSEAYKEKKWGFIPDYARLDTIYRYGGIYMDTDVEVIRPLDELLYNEAYFGFGNYGRVATGLGFGAVSSSKIIHELMSIYDKYESGGFSSESDLVTNTIREEKIFRKHGLKGNGSFQKVLNAAVFPSDFFSPNTPGTGILNITENTFSIHHNNFSWANETEMKEYQDSINKTKLILKRMSDNS